jgi:ATP-dependent Clp protease, protease subunit
MPDLAGQKIAYLGYCGVIDSAGVTRIAQAINSAVNQQYDCVHLCFSSIGGYVGDGIFLYNHLRSLPLAVTMHNIGTVASVATTLFVAAERRICSPNGIFMIHPVAVGTQMQALSSAPLVTALQAALADEERTDAILRDRTKLPEDVLGARRQSDIYITAKQALEYDLVHEVAEFSLPPGNQIFQI